MNDIIYDHYIAIDWSMRNMAIARMTKTASDVKTIDAPSDVGEVKIYLTNLKGTKILVIEEGTTAQWLYTELSDYVDKVLICDPYRNRLLSEGAKTDKIDAVKLVQLLRSGLIKEVYHTSDRFIYLRQVVNGYEDLVKAGVRIQNQRKALLRSCGMKGDEEDEIKLINKEAQYVLDSMNRQINLYEQEKDGYERQFEQFSKKYSEIKHQKSLPCIGTINAVKIVARVITPYRFADKGHYLSYAGLIKLDRISGGRSYGKKKSRFCRQLKSVYKTGISTALKGNNPISDYYKYLILKKGYPEHNARHKACRQLAVLSFGMLKNIRKYQPYRRDNAKKELAESTL